MTVFWRTAQHTTLRGLYLVMLLLCAWISFTPNAKADAIISDPATLRIPGFPDQLASAHVILPNHNDATIQFTDTNINLIAGALANASTNLILNNTGVNPLQTTTINVALPAGINAVILSTADYTATQQPNGSWVLVFANPIAPGGSFIIPLQLSIGDINAATGGDITADLNANTAAIASAKTTVQVNNTITSLFLQNTVSRDLVIHDETVTYTLRVSNQLSSNTVNNIQVSDLLPPGLRFMPGTVSINSQATNDPAVSSDGRTLIFSGANTPWSLNANETLTIEYMAYISNATPATKLASPSSASGILGANIQVVSNPDNADITVRKDPINTESHVLGRVVVGECPVEDSESLELVNTRLQSELVDNTILYTVTVGSQASSVEEYNLHIELPESIKPLASSFLLDGKNINEPNPGKSNKVLTLKPQGNHWQHTLSFKAFANPSKHGTFSTTIYGTYKTAESDSLSTKKISNSYQASLENKSFRRFSYWPRFERLGANLKDGDISNIDELLEKTKGETVNHIYIVGHADNMKISEKNKAIYESNMALSEARANNTAAYIRKALNLTEHQVTAVGRGDAEPVTDNRDEEGRATNRRVELIVEILNQEDVNRLNIILGDEGYASSKVFTTSPPAGESIAGVQDIRLITETGRTVDTDENGLYHFEAMKPGTHVIQIDPDSIPDTMEPVLCHANTRFAGTPTSRFVEVGNGLIWRADFYLREKELPKQTVNISLHSKVKEKNVHYMLSATGTELIHSPAKLLIQLPTDASIIPESLTLDGKNIPAQRDGNNIYIELGSHKDTWKHNIEFTIDSTQLDIGSYVVKSQLQTNNKNHPALNTNYASNTFTIQASPQRIERYEFKTHFLNSGTELSKADKVTIEDIVFLFRGQTITNIKVIGHTDSNIMSPETKAKFGNNYNLSKKRAESVANYILEKLNIKNVNVETIGKGASQPIASNSTKQGRAENRRVEFYVQTAQTSDKPELGITKAKSDVQVVIPTRIKPSASAKSQEVKEKPVVTPDGISSIKDGSRIAALSHAIRVQLDSRLKMSLQLDGEEIPHDKIGFKMIDKKTNKAIYTFFGVNTGEKGPHKLQLRGIGPFGNARFEQTINYTRTGNIDKIKLIKDSGIENTADGVTPLRAELALYDNEGERIQASAELLIEDGTLKPYIADKNSLDNQIKDTKNKVSVNADGLIEFAPVNKAGLYTATLRYNDVEVDIKVYAKPKYRDWVMVGLAEGTLGSNDADGNIQNLQNADIEDEFYKDGRLAFYAKGKILGKYLLTTAFDSSKERKEDERLQQVINPNDYYTLYGDDTEQQFDAASREKLYIRLDADRFYAMFGDMSTGMNVTKLSRYTRSLTGFKTAYESEHITFNAFAAETNQSFKKDEILGQGISGLYNLTAKNIVANSETIRIEVRDRFHPEIIVSSKELSRFADYNIDYQDGSLYFKEAVPRHGDNFNPVYIVAEYESRDKTNEDIVAGGRAAVKFNDEKIEIGVSAVDDGTKGAEGQLQGVDVRTQITKNIEFKAEYAQTENKPTTTTTREGSAYLAEVIRDGKSLDVRAYVREDEAGFGLGQQNQSNAGIRKYGTQAAYQLNDNIKFTADASHQDNLDTLNERDVFTTKAQYNKEGLTLDAGASIAEDKDSNGNTRTAEQLSLGASQQFFDKKLRLRANTQWQINKDNQNADYPTRHLVGADYKLTALVDVFAEHEVANNQALQSNTSRVGLRSRPWDNATINSSVERNAGEYDERTAAVFGLTQTVHLNDKWKASFSYDQTQTLQKTSIDRVNTNAPLASGSSFTNIPSTGSVDNDFWAVSTGLAYKTSLYLFDNRLEYRKADANNKYALISSWRQELVNGVGHALRLQLFVTEDAVDSSADQTDAELRYSSVYRPFNSKWIVLNRTELKYDENTTTTAGVQSKRFVENLAINYLPYTHWQIAGHFGYKHLITETNNNEFTTDSYVIGSETRYDINEHWDIGAQYHTLFTAPLGLRQESWGLSAGVDVAKNLWLSLGYNFEGYHDDDFSVNGFTAQGAYLKLRFKFDQNTFNLNGGEDK